MGWQSRRVQRRPWRWVIALGLAMGAAGCSISPPSAAPTVARTPASPAALATGAGATIPSAGATSAAVAPGCPVTTPRPAPDEIGTSLFGSAVAYGNDQLWVGGLGPKGVIAAPAAFVEADGSIGWKLGWWRVARGVLTITGRRIDGPSPPLRSDVPDGYGSSGFQASGVYFPAAGCWQVTGRVGGATLTFVVFVVKV